MKALALIGILLVCAGCVSHGALGPLPAVDPANSAEIAVIRDHLFVGAAGTVRIQLDGVPLYGLDAGEPGMGKAETQLRTGWRSSRFS